MKSVLVLFFVLCAQLMGISEAWGSTQKLSLNVGEIEVIEVGEVTRLAVGNDDVLTASVLETGHLMLIPILAGETDLVVWKTGERKQHYQVKILPTDMIELQEVTESILRNYDRVTTRAVGDKILVEGMVEPEEAERFQQLVEKYPNLISVVRPVRGNREMIEMKVQVLELDKRYRKDLGIDWADNANGPMVTTIGSLLNNEVGYRVVPETDNDIDWLSVIGLIPPTDKTFYPYAGLATSVTSRINFLQENGAARVLAEPTLSTRSGEVASFLAGGSIPFPFTDSDGQTTVQFQEYGIQLDIEPTIDSNGTIVSNIRAEISSIDNGVQVLGVPGLLIRETESVVSIQPGDTVAISGLLTTNDTKTINSVPLLGEIPVLGSLFRSESLEEQRTEIVFLVTTKVVDVKSPAVNDRVEKQLKEMQEIQGNGGVFNKLLAE
ncbi:secretion protein [Arenicella chitinivorans]|uniref:Secretion protein n=2 Tax=Arenicella chitinivorans TaxID=1329800 RepID=A0A918VI91_9GAMM|nr:secretion protein [Arenicella chitinivorans]